MNEVTHKVGSVKVNLKVGSQHQLYSFMDKFSTCIQDGIARSLDRHNKLDQLIQIDRLTVDLQGTSREVLLSQIQHELDTAIRQSLSRVEDAKGMSLETIESHEIFNEPYEFFLNYGSLPWNVKTEEFSLIEEFEKALLNWDVEKWKQVVSVKTTQIRLAKALEKKQFERLLDKLDGTFQALWNEAELSWMNVLKSIAVNPKPQLVDDVTLRVCQLQMILSGLGNSQRYHEVWFEVFLRQCNADELKAFSLAAHRLVSEKKSPDDKKTENRSQKRQVIEVLHDWLEERNFEKVLEKESGIESNNSSQKSYFIQNAGLIILWPGFNHLLQTCGYLSEGQFTSEELKERAVVLLHYLCFKQISGYEYEMAFNKLLCGMDPEAPINPTIELSEKELQTADEIRSEIRKEWSAIQQFSEKELIGNFLAREGKISRQENGWLLQVERKTWDVFLDKLPWGIGVVRLPWIEGLIYVEW